MIFRLFTNLLQLFIHFHMFIYLLMYLLIYSFYLFFSSVAAKYLDQSMISRRQLCLTTAGEKCGLSRRSLLLLGVLSPVLLWLMLWLLPFVMDVVILIFSPFPLYMCLCVDVWVGGCVWVWVWVCRYAIIPSTERKCCVVLLTQLFLCSCVRMSSKNWWKKDAFYQLLWWITIKLKKKNKGIKRRWNKSGGFKKKD